MCFTALTSNTIQFSRSYIPLCDDMLRLYNPNQHHLVTAAFSEILAAQLRHADKATTIQKHSQQVTADKATTIQKHSQQVTADKVMTIQKHSQQVTADKATTSQKHSQQLTADKVTTIRNTHNR